MEWNASTIAILGTSIAALLGILPQIVKTIADSLTDKQKANTEAKTAQTQEIVQLAGATQTMQSANIVLITALQDEIQDLRTRLEGCTTGLSKNERQAQLEHLNGQRMLNDIVLLQERHRQEYAGKTVCRFGAVLDRKLQAIVDKYKPIFANGLVTDMSKEEYIVTNDEETTDD